MSSTPPETTPAVPGTHKISQGAALANELPTEGATIIDRGDAAAIVTSYTPGELTWKPTASA